ncbi:hypothetical protein ACHQM5_001811 [Ranunculus cassubicifolius]
MAPICPRKEWMNARLLSDEYVEGAKAFIKFTQQCLGEKVDWYCCPCLICHLDVKNTAENVYEHLICNGIDTSYTRWIYHGEPFSKNRSTTRVPKHPNLRKETRQSRLGAMINEVFGRSHPDNLDACLDEVEDNGGAQYMDESEDAVENALGENTNNNPKEDIRYKKLMEDALQPLYPSCKEEDTKLSAVIELLSMKAKYRISNDCFTTLLSFLKRILPENNVVPENTSKAKTMIKSLRMKCEIIDACRNDCILYWGVHKDHVICPTCNESRWKPLDESRLNAKRKPWKKLRYFPLTERL